MKLKQIYEEVAAGKPVDIKHLRAEIDAVLAEIAEDVGALQNKKKADILDHSPNGIGVLLSVEIG
jgi:hypothetical protein